MTTPKPTEPEPFHDGADLVLHIRLQKSDIPGAIRVRALLKGLLRRLQIRCLSIGPATPAAAKERGAAS